MKKVLFLHGFTSSGQCEIAHTLRQELSDVAEVISPDIPLHPQEALRMIRAFLDSNDSKQKIDLIVGSSCGAYYALFLTEEFGVEQVLVNPQRNMVPFLEQRIGRRNYKSPRKDGKDYFIIDAELIAEFAALGEPKVSEQSQRMIFALLGDEDPLRASRKEDFQHKEFFLGSHTMNAQQVREYLAPKCRQILTHKGNNWNTIEVNKKQVDMDQNDMDQNNKDQNNKDQNNKDQNNKRQDSIVVKTVPLEDYIKDCRDSEYFIRFCKECRNYGRLWACPPLVDQEVEGRMRYKWATLVANHIVPTDPKAPISQASEIMKPTRRITERILLEAEKVFPGRSFAFAGTCLYCPQGTCTRLENRPCRHPELVRPSLEAVGFDISKTASILGVELLWSKDEHVPPYLTLVSGFFHDAEPEKVEEFILKQYGLYHKI